MSANLEIDLYFSQVATGEIDAVVNSATDVIGIYQNDPVMLYRLACVFALSVNAIADARRPDPLTPQDKRMQMRCKLEAMRCLQRAHDAGFDDFFQTSIDADFSALRDDPAMLEFEAGHVYRLGVLAKKRGAAEVAKTHFEKSQAIAEASIKALRSDPRRTHLKLLWLCGRVQLGHPDDAAAQTEGIWAELPKRSPAVVRVARVFALASGATDNTAQKTVYGAKALTALEQLPVETLNQTLLADEDLDTIREDPRFQKVLKRVIEYEKQGRR